MKIHINYAHGRYLNSQKNCCSSALALGGFDRSIAYRYENIDPEFVRQNSYIFSQPRGAGCWIWKPYLLSKTLESVQEGDWIMYTDSGMHFVRNPWEWIMSNEHLIGEKGIATFGTCNKNKVYCKRDAFVLMGLDEPEYTDSEQRTASIFLCKKTPFSVDFVARWLRWCCDPRILTDLPNTQGKPNYPEFLDHRHDQSVMSLMCIKDDVCLLEDMTQFMNPNPFVLHTRNPA
jgi:hypothetical protein